MIKKDITHEILTQVLNLPELNSIEKDLRRNIWTITCHGSEDVIEKRWYKSTEEIQIERLPSYDGQGDRFIITKWIKVFNRILRKYAMRFDGKWTLWKEAEEVPENCILEIHPDNNYEW